MTGLSTAAAERTVSRAATSRTRVAPPERANGSRRLTATPARHPVAIAPAATPRVAVRPSRADCCLARAASPSARSGCATSCPIARARAVTSRRPASAAKDAAPGRDARNPHPKRRGVHPARSRVPRAAPPGYPERHRRARAFISPSPMSHSSPSSRHANKHCAWEIRT